MRVVEDFADGSKRQRPRCPAPKVVRHGGLGMMENFRITSLEADDASLRRACREGTLAYANALSRAGYSIKAAPGCRPGAAFK